MKQVKSNAQLDILVDLSLCMTTYMFGLLLEQKQSDKFFIEIRKRYIKQGFDKKLSNETLDEIKQIVDMFKKGE